MKDERVKETKRKELERKELERKELERKDKSRKNDEMKDEQNSSGRRDEETKLRATNFSIRPSKVFWAFEKNISE
jgi:hypothetical protein